MSRPSENFRVQSPARAYGVMVALSGLILAVGLILPLALASSVPPDTGSNQSINGPVRSSGDPVTSREPGGTSRAQNIPPSTQGVTDTTIKVGFVMLDLSGAESVGLGLDNFEIDLQKAKLKSLVDGINAAGGINSRKIVPVYARLDPLQISGPHSYRGMCLNLARDERVFAVVGYANATGVCASTQYHLPVVNANGFLEQAYTKSNGLFVSLGPKLQRFGQTWADALVRSKIIDGRKLGLLMTADNGESQLPAEATAAQLKALGHELTVTGKSDATNLNALPTLVQKMKNKGVNTVLLASDFVAAVRFVFFADSQHYKPQYLTSEIGSLAADGLVRGVGPGFNGAIGMTSGEYEAPGKPENPATKQCRESYNALPGVKPVAAGTESALPQICALVEIFKKAATGAGKELNARTFVEAVEKIGSIPDLPSVIAGSFGPGKTDYSDGIRPIRWSSKTKSYSAAGPPIPTGK